MMITRTLTDLYTLKRPKKLLRKAYRLYLKKRKVLDAQSKEKIELQLTSLQRAILVKNVSLATQIAQSLEKSALTLMPRTFWDKIRDSALSIAFALIVAVAVRGMWFELYTIPTGSMRPTLKESDFLVVSKTDFGINIPLKPAHFYFDPSLVQRGEIFVFTSENLDLADTDTNYFFLFPGKKQFVKRLIGKPGDTLYFYGGQIYGIDTQGQPFDTTWINTVEHIPFIRFDGTVDTPLSPQHGVFPKAIFSQMHIPIAEMSLTPLGTFTGKMLLPASQHGDLWGMKNYAMARLLTASQVEQIAPDALSDLEQGVLYLELRHHPDIQQGTLILDEQGRYRPNFTLSTSILPLKQSHLDTLLHHMTTCRFHVKGGKAARLGMSHDSPYAHHFPHLADVPDGTYEFQDGVAYQIYWLGLSKKLPLSHPLYQNTPEKVQLLYNLGMEFLNQYNPAPHNRFFPSRYAYFRDRSLYLLGAPLLTKEDPALILFLTREYQKQSLSTSVHPYFPFDDAGAPLAQDGSLDTEFIRKMGLRLPSKSYLALGDNHAMSADSRVFGFVPQDNLRGGASFLFWPPGPRFGRLPQPIHPTATIPNLLIWSTAAAIALASSLYIKRRFYRPLKF